MKIFTYLAALSLIFLVACSSLILKPADFAWPIESVVNVENNGNAIIKRYSITFSTKELFLKKQGIHWVIKRNS